MKKTMRKIAPYFLLLTLLALIATFGLFIVYKVFNTYIQISLAVAALSLAVWVIFDPDHVRQIFSGRQAKHGSNAVIMTIAFIGIIVVVNLLGYKYSPRWDLSEGKQNTLAPETINILKQLPEVVNVKAFYSSSNPSTTVQALLENFERNANGKFTFEFIDPNTNPVAAQDARVTTDGTLVLRMGEREEKITYASEVELDTALLKLINPEKKNIYFLGGHGEFDVNTTTDYGYSTVKSSLEDKNYSVATLDLLTSSNIPEDAEVIVIASPQKPLSEKEVQSLKAYMDNGGSLIVFNEPSIISQFGSEPDLLAEYIAETWGLTFDDNIVLFLDKEPSVMAVAGGYDTTHPITQKMNQIASVFPSARTISISNAPMELSQSILVYTSDQYWGETDIANIETAVSFDKDVDLVGPVALVAAAENLVTGSRLVAIGDGEFAANAFISYYGNLDFIINTIDWAAQQENLISLTPKETTDRILITPNSVTLGLVLLLTVFVIPLLIIVAGIIAWVQRRRRG